MGVQLKGPVWREESLNEWAAWSQEHQRLHEEPEGLHHPFTKSAFFPNYMLMGLQRRKEGPKMNLSPDGKTNFVQMKRVQKICPRDTMQM